ncbi:hypothetical protein, partial [Tabrizicola sp.]|uniref:hypothetical protein n=1 Tax=Tabrizicola sp. TaxID=2005166 RepID=UPI00286A3D9C
MARQTFYFHALGSNGVLVGIFPEVNGRYKIMYGKENLGSYHSPEAALDDLIGGHTFAPSDGADTSHLGFPEDLLEWFKKP